MNDRGVIAAILRGEFDDIENEIVGAINSRRRMRRDIESYTALGTVQVGTKVRLEGLSPKYLNGLTGEVVGKRGKRFTVRLDNPALAGRYANFGQVQAPASTVKPL
jgi:hypothetical protein